MRSIYRDITLTDTRSLLMPVCTLCHKITHSKSIGHTIWNLIRYHRLQHVSEHASSNTIFLLVEKINQLTSIA